MAPPTRRMVITFLILFGTRQAWAAASEDLPMSLNNLGEKARGKVEAFLKDHTIKRSPRLTHPILNRPLHQFLLDRPDVGAAIARILGIGTYTTRQVGADRFHGSDGEGAEGDLEILHRETARRVYFVHGLAEGALFTVRGSAVILQEFQYRSTNQGEQWVETQLTIYAKIENPFLAFLVKVLAPLVGGLVEAKITKALAVVEQVSEVMAQHPRETYRRIEASDELEPEALKALSDLMEIAEAFSATGEAH